MSKVRISARMALNLDNDGDRVVDNKENNDNDFEKGFVVDEPLKKTQSHIEFIHKADMGKEDADNGIKFIFKDIIENSSENDAKRIPVRQRSLHPSILGRIDVESSNKEVINKVSISKKDKNSDNEGNLPNIENLPRSISKISNMIKDWMNYVHVFSSVRDEISNKELLDVKIFYTQVQNCIYHSLKEFCGIRKNEKNSDIFPCDVTPDLRQYQTLVFFDRMYNSKPICWEKDVKIVMSKYRETFSDADGIQREWLEILNRRMQNKLIGISQTGLDTIIEMIKGEWCSTEVTDKVEPVVVTPMEVKEVKSYNNEEEDDDEDDDDDDEDSDDEDEDDEEYEHLKIAIVRDSDEDVIRIFTTDHFGEVIIPFYVKLEEISPIEDIPSMSDTRNGNWDWLIHLVPDFMFKTKDPDKYMASNNDEYDSGDNMKFVIMNKSNDEYMMGVHSIDGVYFVDDDGNETLVTDEEVFKKINYLVNSEVASGYLSHLRKSLSDPSLFRTEKYVELSLGNCDDEEDDDEDGNEIIVSEDVILNAAMESVSAEEESSATEDNSISQIDTNIMPASVHYNGDEEEFVPFKRNRQKLRD